MLYINIIKYTCYIHSGTLDNTVLILYIMRCIIQYCTYSIHTLHIIRTLLYYTYIIQYIGAGRGARGVGRGARGAGRGARGAGRRDVTIIFIIIIIIIISIISIIIIIIIVITTVATIQLLLLLLLLLLLVLLLLLLLLLL